MHSSIRYPALDGLRGLAILLVLSWNYSALFSAIDGTWGATVKSLFRLNWSGVDLFFVLSGFLIGGIILDHREAPNFLRVFYLRRACRIFPPYYLLLLVFGGALLLWRDEPGLASLLSNQGTHVLNDGATNRVPLWSYAVYLQNWWMASTNSWGPGFLAPTWSLAVEEQFYLVLPIVVLSLAPSRVWWLATICIIAAPLLRLQQGWLPAYCLLPSRMDALMAGVLIAWLLRRDAVGQWLRVNRRALRLSFGALAAGVGLLLYAPDILGRLNHSWLAMFYGLGIVLLVSRSPESSPLLHARWLRWTGLISYGDYLLHWPVLGLVFGVGVGRKPAIMSGTDVLLALGSLVLTFAIASLSYRFMEKPLISLGQRYRYQSREAHLLRVVGGRANP